MTRAPAALTNGRYVEENFYFLWWCLLKVISCHRTISSVMYSRHIGTNQQTFTIIISYLTTVFCPQEPRPPPKSVDPAADYQEGASHVLSVIHEILAHHRQLESKWHAKKIKLHQRLALRLFQEDVKQVSDEQKHDKTWIHLQSLRFLTGLKNTEKFSSEKMLGSAKTFRKQEHIRKVTKLSKGLCR